MEICATLAIIMGPLPLRGAFLLLSLRVRAIDGKAPGVIGLPVLSRSALDLRGVSLT